MSLFDEFDRLTPDPGKDPRILPERKASSSAGTSKLSSRMPSTETVAVRPADSIRFSLSRGAVISIVLGMIAAAALLYAGGFLTSYVIFQPNTGVQMAKNRNELPPPSLVDTDRSRIKAVEQKEDDGAGPLKVLMSSETSGGQAVVARQSDVSEAKPRGAPSNASDAALSGVTVPTNNPIMEKALPEAPLPPEVETEALKSLQQLVPALPKTEQEALRVVKPVKPRPVVPLSSGSSGLSSEDSIVPDQNYSAAPVGTSKPANVVSSSRENPSETLSSAEPDSPVVPGSVAYTVQLGAFSSDSNAKRLLEKMSADIPGLRVESGKTPSGRTLYYLRAGLYANRSEAKDFEARLKTEKNIKSGYVIRVKAPSPAGGN
ncbi:MAG: hypothetical protein CMM28_07790 [Rhodospirillaceae bacterium]|nr:hypothetical protein [Rhodospirillaceae bacterium]|tara:strand:- start:1000 stop:2124 length:1125 start_codon:yes stop_codon:yes gene_type:complete